MNIFYLHHDPRAAAQWHCDRHCSKMIIEYAQLLSTAWHVLGLDNKGATSLTHVNHPSAVWVRESADHYRWLVSLWRELHTEFEWRRLHKHKCYVDRYRYLKNPPVGMPEKGFVEPPQCMDEKYKIDGDCVAAYQQYYRKGKTHVVSYQWGRLAPSWLNISNQPKERSIMNKEKIETNELWLEGQEIRGRMLKDFLEGNHKNHAKDLALLEAAETKGFDALLKSTGPK